MNNRWDMSRLSFLIVEDNQHMRGILRSILTGLGARTIFEAMEATDGLEMAIDRQPDFILCDWAMHPVSGGEFIQFIRAEKDPLLSTTPIIVISAHSRKATILEARKLGIHGFVAKPVAPAVLYQRIGNVLDYQASLGRSKGIFAQALRQREVNFSSRKEESVTSLSDQWDQSLKEAGGFMALL